MNKSPLDHYFERDIQMKTGRDNLRIGKQTLPGEGGRRGERGGGREGNE